MGIGQALLEHVAFDDASGQLLSGSFMDSAMPKAEHFSWVELHDLPDRCRSNPIGVKGAGESGTVGAPPTVINAIVDALRDRGVTVDQDHIYSVELGHKRAGNPLRWTFVC